MAPSAPRIFPCPFPLIQQTVLHARLYPSTNRQRSTPDYTVCPRIQMPFFHLLSSSANSSPALAALSSKKLKGKTDAF